MDLTDLCVARWQEQYVSPLRRMKVNESSTSTGYISQSVVHKPWASDLLWAREGIKNADSGLHPGPQNHSQRMDLTYLASSPGNSAAP